MTCQREQVKISNSNNYYNSKGKNNDNNNKKMEKNKHTMNVHVLMIIDTFVHFYILITSFETVPKGMKQTLIQTLKIYYNKIWLLMYSSIKITTFRQHNILFFTLHTHTILNPLKSSHSKTALMYTSQSQLGVLILGQNLEGVYHSTQASTAHVFCCHCINNMKF